MQFLSRSVSVALVTVVTGAVLVHVPAEARPSHARSAASHAKTRSVDAPPTRSAQIRLIAPVQLAVDRTGHRYVVDNTNQVLVYAPTATGDVERPARSIGGRSTKLLHPCGVAVDDAGYLYVGSSIGSLPHGHPELEGHTGMITVYAPGANGDVAPVRTIVGDRTGLDSPCDLAVRGGEVYAANYGNGSITVHRTDADGDAAPRRVVAGPATGLSGNTADDAGPVPVTLAVAANGALHVGANTPGWPGGPVTPRGTVSVFVPGARGNVAPVRKLDGTRLGFAWVNDVALDRAGNLYVANGGEFASDGARGNVQVFRKGATGKKPAAVRLGGSASRVHLPRALQVLDNGSVVVLDRLPLLSLNTYAPLVRPKHRAGLDRQKAHLKAHKKAHKKKAHLKAAKKAAKKAAQKAKGRR